MQPKTTRSPWFVLTKTLLGTSVPLRAASAAGSTTGWRHFGVEVGQQLRRYLCEFYEVPEATNYQVDELAPLVLELQQLAKAEPNALLAWTDFHLPAVLEGADHKQRLEFAAGMREGAAK